MKKLVLGLASLGLVAFAAPASANVAQFTGQWVNLNPVTQGVTRVVVTVDGAGQIRVHAWGQCQPADCDWGSVPGKAFCPSPGDNPVANAVVITARVNAGFAQKLLIIERAGPDRITVKVLTDF